MQLYILMIFHTLYFPSTSKLSVALQISQKVKVNVIPTKFLCSTTWANKNAMKTHQISIISVLQPHDFLIADFDCKKNRVNVIRKELCFVWVSNPFLLLLFTIHDIFSWRLSIQETLPFVECWTSLDSFPLPLSNKTFCLWWKKPFLFHIYNCALWKKVDTSAFPTHCYVVNGFRSSKFYNWNTKRLLISVDTYIFGNICIANAWKARVAN